MYGNIDNLAGFLLARLCTRIETLYSSYSKLFSEIITKQLKPRVDKIQTNPGSVKLKSNPDSLFVSIADLGWT